MVRELLVFRHGKAKEFTGGADKDRPLKDRGKRQAQRMGSWMEQHGVLPDVAISSPAERALVTAEKALKAGGLEAGSIVTDKRLYSATLESVMAVLADHSHAKGRIMLVGHNPGLEDLVRHLASSSSLPAPENGHVMVTGALVRLSLPPGKRLLSAGGGRVLDYIRPDTLPERFPFPGPDGTEYRARPAYYYTQSAVIPYREKAGKLQIMIISSSAKKHWVVPKGIHTPGLTAQESAAKEAREEAGILGKVSSEAVGRYVYPKWEASCTVVVYPMKVTKVISGRDGDENHRDRRWVSPKKAVAHLEQKALKDIVADFAAGYGKGGE